jgi:hypothetical protein
MFKLTLTAIAASVVATAAWAGDCPRGTRPDPIGPSEDGAVKCVCDYGYTVKGGKCAEAVEKTKPKPKPKVD